jgi:hypothetical protein
MPHTLDHYLSRLKPSREAVGLTPGLGVHRLSIRFDTPENLEADANAPLSFAGELWVRDLPGNIGWVGPLSQPSLHKPRFASRLDMNATITDAQLRLLEKLRAGRELQLQVDLTMTVIGKVGAWPTAERQFMVSIPHVEWARILNSVDAGAFVDVQVPITNIEGRAIAARRLREGNLAILNGDFEGAVSKARSVFDAVRPACKTKELYATAWNKKPDDRTQDERWAMLIQSAFALFSGAPHDDQGTTEHFEWSRADAVAALATAAGLLARLEDLP